MKKIFSKENLQKFLFAGVVVLVFGVFMLSLFLSNDNTEKPGDDNNDNNIQEPTPGDPNEPNLPDDKKSEKFKQPCETSCEIVRYFYSLDSEEEVQEMSLIQFGSSFFTSRGVSYGKSDNTNFDVYAALSGKVINVEESTVQGLCVTIDHGDGVLTEYMGLSEAKVSVDDEVALGDVIGVSGVTEYDAAANNHVHFRVSINGVYIDPLKVIGKSVEDINK